MAFDAVHDAVGPHLPGHTGTWRSTWRRGASPTWAHWHLTQYMTPWGCTYLGTLALDAVHDAVGLHHRAPPVANHVERVAQPAAWIKHTRIYMSEPTHTWTYFKEIIYKIKVLFVVVVSFLLHLYIASFLCCPFHLFWWYEETLRLLVVVYKLYVHTTYCLVAILSLKGGSLSILPMEVCYIAELDFH